MIDRVRKWFPVIFLMVLAGLSYWLEDRVRQSSMMDTADSGHVPDVVVAHLSATQLGVDGKPRELLSADRLQHYADDDSTRLDNPALQLVSPGKPDMRVDSKWALLSKNGNDIYLHEDVKVVRAPFDGRSRMEMTTDFLHLNPDSHVGETARPVRIRDASMDIHAVGMAFNDETRVVKLLSHVHGHYEK